MARPKTPEERARRISDYTEMSAKGMSLKAIAAAWGCSPSSLREWRGANGLAPPLKRTVLAEMRKREPRPDVEAAKASPKMERNCLTCGNTFTSQRADGAWLRLCDRCRAAPRSVYTPGGAGDTGRRIGGLRTPVR